MSDDALKAVLDREGVSSIVDRHFREQINLLEELVDYGTNLLARAFGSSPSDFKATYLLFVHLQQFLAHLDGVAILLKRGSCLTAHLQLRTMLENLMVLKWLLASDTDKKIDHIWVANWRARKQSQSIGVPGTLEAKKHAAAAAQLTITPDQIIELTKQIAGIDKMLAEPARAPVNASFEAVYAKRGFDPHWYDLCGAPSIRQIAIQQGKQAHYDYLYSPFSGVTHGGDIWKSIAFKKDGVEVNALRDAKEVPKLCEMAVSFSLDTFRLILNEYRFAELEAFRKKYLEEWRERYRKVFSAEFKTEFTTI